MLPAGLWLIGLFVFYVVLHISIQRLTPNLNRWAGTVIALTPAVTLMFSGNGVAAFAALSYVGISLLVDVGIESAGVVQAQATLRVPIMMSIVIQQQLCCRYLIAFLGTQYREMDHEHL